MRREGRSFFALIAGLIALNSDRSAPVDAVSAEPYRGIALGVEAAWPSRAELRNTD